MQANRSRDTSVEVAVRRAVHARGLRYKKHRRPLPGVRCEPDIVFPAQKIAVFVDGCWWHGCPQHWSPPKANREWWTHKIDITMRRDRLNDAAFRAAGWTVVRIWEHEEPISAAERIDSLVRPAV
jgi:DNA mismatch endonuclease (patch repair protein)